MEPVFATVHTMVSIFKKHDDDEESQFKPGKAVRSKTKSTKSRQQKFLSGSRFTLFIGDEGAILLYLKRNRVISRQFVPDASDENLRELQASLAQDTAAPLSFVLDIMDQTYSQQTLPPVNSLNVRKLIDRRLKRDFAPQDIKGGLLLGREKTGRQDWNFLMVSIERTKQISMWLDFAMLLPNRFQGIYLASVEAELIVKHLEEAIGLPKEESSKRWKIFVSHNKVGGFRQVVLRNGRIIFTRLSQPIGDATPEIIAGNIEQEMQSTIEYMKRLSYNTQAGLDVYIVVSSAIQPLIDKSKFFASTFTIMTPFEIAQYLGIEGATQPTDQFGDVILAASIAANPQHVLTLSTPEVKKYDNLYALLYFQRIVAVIVAIAIFAYGSTIGLDIYGKYSQGEELTASKAAHQKNLSDLHDEIKKSNLDINDTGDLMEEYQLLQKEMVVPFGFIKKVQGILKPPAIIKHVDWSVEDKTAAGNALLPPKMNVVLTVQFPDVVDAKTFKIFSQELLDNLKVGLKNFDITFGALPSKYTEVESVNVNFDTANTPAPATAKEIPDVTLIFKEQ